MAMERVLSAAPVDGLAAYQEHDGGRALEIARKVPPEAVLDELDAAGLRGRGGAGFPTGRKWRTVAGNRSEVVPSTVIVNAAEGEPGTFKDRAILRANPYQVLEGALVAAQVIGADSVVVATKATFGSELTRLRHAVNEITAAGWLDGIELELFEGPGEYLYGEETALLEAVAGRPPFPRIAPPYRRGIDEVVESDADVASESGLPAHVTMATEEPGNVAPPTLVNNVETLANIPQLVVRGSDWFRRVGTMESPGTIVCTITGRVQHPGVGEVEMGTTLREAIEEIGGGTDSGRRVVAVLPGVSNPLLSPAALSAPLTYEGMQGVGSGLGSAGFIVLDDSDDLVAVAAGACRFLAVESCGQCTPCKQDGLAMAELLARISRSEADAHDLERLVEHTSTVADGARCNLALQQQIIVSGLLRDASQLVQAHLDGTSPPREPMVVAELLDIDDEGAAVDVRHVEKQPDWTYDDEDSGMAPVDRLTDHRAT